MQYQFLLIFLVVMIIAIPSISAALTDNITAYWKLNDNAANTKVIDSLMANNGTGNQNSNVFSIKGKVFEAFSYDGNDNVNCGNSTALNITDDITLSVWFKWDGSGGVVQEIVAKDDGTVTTAQYRIWMNNNDDKLYAGFRTHVTWASSNNTIDTTNWHHAVMTASTSDNVTKLYLDGVLQTQGTAAREITTAPLRIGAGKNSVGDYFTGDIDEVAIWNRRLSQEEVTLLYNNNLGMQYPFNLPIFTLNKPLNNSNYSTTENQNFSCSAQNASLVRMQVWNSTLLGYLTNYWDFEELTDASKATDFTGNINLTIQAMDFGATGNFSRAFSFDGIDNYLVYASPLDGIGPADNWSACFWAYPRKNSTGNAFIFGNYKQNDTRSMCVFGTGNQFICSTYNGTAAAGVAGVRTSAVSYSSWYHICYSKSGTTGTIYKNGANATAASTSLTGATSTGFDIGTTTAEGSTQFFNGSIDEIMLFNKSLTAGEVSKIYNDGLQGHGLITRYSNFSGIDGFHNYTDNLGAGNYSISCSGWNDRVYNNSNTNLFMIYDTCTPPAINNNWNILFSDNCVISSNANIGTGNLSVYGNGGSLTINADITTKKSIYTCEGTNCKVVLNNGGRIILT